MNGEWIQFDQDEPPYFPGEVGNDPHARSKCAPRLAAPIRGLGADAEVERAAMIAASQSTHGTIRAPRTTLQVCPRQMSITKNTPICRHALAHIWHEWDGMVEVVAHMKAAEKAGVLLHPRGAGEDAVSKYIAAVRTYQHALDHVPWTPNEASAWWDAYMRSHPDNRWNRAENQSAQQQQQQQQQTNAVAKL